MRLADLKIDPDFKNLLPELDAETYTNLEKDIVKNGMFDPIITWNGFIADGHNRYEICKAHRIADVQTKELVMPTKSEVMQWIVDHQYARRILLKSEKVKVLLKVEAQIAKEAAERVGGRPKKGDEKPTSNLTDVLDKGETAEIMAKKMGTSKNTWKDASLIVRKGTPDQINRMNKGGRGNGISTIAKEIKDGVVDGERKCNKCGRILKIAKFTDKTRPNTCVDCETKRKREQRDQKLLARVMPDTLNPDVKEEITDDIIIEKFVSILTNAESSFRTLLKYEVRMNDLIRSELIVAINKHIEGMNILKGEMKNETEGQNI